MPNVIDFDDFDGLRNITSASGQKERLGVVLQGFVDDIELLRASQATIITKLNTDFVAQNIAVTSSQLDEDYVSPAAAAITNTKGRIS